MRFFLAGNGQFVGDNWGRRESPKFSKSDTNCDIFSQNTQVCHRIIHLYLVKVDFKCFKQETGGVGDRKILKIFA